MAYYTTLPTAVYGFQIFKIVLGVEVVLLFIQFWLGVSINLFVKLPLNTAQDFSSYYGGTEVLAHIINGIQVLALAELRYQLSGSYLQLYGGCNFGCICFSRPMRQPFNQHCYELHNCVPNILV
jgi:hypothetical protein